MKVIHRHYDTVAAELEGAEWDGVLPSRTHSIVLVSKLHLPTLRALAYARATRPDTLEAITVNVDEEDTRKLVRRMGDQRHHRAAEGRSSRRTVRSPGRCSTTSGVCGAIHRVTW